MNRLDIILSELADINTTLKNTSSRLELIESKLDELALELSDIGNQVYIMKDSLRD